MTATVSINSSDTGTFGLLHRELPADAMDPTPPPPETGMRVGNYRLQDRLGAGLLRARAPPVLPARAVAVPVAVTVAPGAHRRALVRDVGYDREHRQAEEPFDLLAGLDRPIQVVQQEDERDAGEQASAEPEREVPRQRRSERPARHERLVHDAHVRLARRLQPGRDVRLGLLAKQLVEQFAWSARHFSTSPFSTVVMQDDRNPEVYIANVGQGGLGLPDRDMYDAKNQQFEPVRQGLRSASLSPS